MAEAKLCTIGGPLGTPPGGRGCWADAATPDNAIKPNATLFISKNRSQTLRTEDAEGTEDTEELEMVLRQIAVRAFPPKTFLVFPCPPSPPCPPCVEFSTVVMPPRSPTRPSTSPRGCTTPRRPT